MERGVLLVFLLLTVLVTACARGGASLLDDAAREYVQLALELGEHDPDYVDAYYGPAEWREAARRSPRPLARIAVRARELAARISDGGPEKDELVVARRHFLAKQLASLAARAEMLTGKTLSFDDESRALYDAVSPHHSPGFYARLVERLDAELPGRGPVPERYVAFRKRFEIPREKLSAVFDAAVAECRRRTLAHIELPENESFEIEYVTGKPWSAYNWYKGNYHSLIQVNTDLPVTIDRAIDLACHEGYPGHHVYNVLLERNFVRERGWVEFQIYPLFSPMSLIAEGSANHGIEVAFSRSERLAFERDVLFPLAGLDPAEAERFAKVRELAEVLSYAGNEAAHDYLDGLVDKKSAIIYLTRYGLMSRERAEQRIAFIEKYRSYVINYNVGRDLVARHVQGRWEPFVELLTSLRLASDLS